MSDSLRTMEYIAHQAPLSMEFSRQEYWSGWPLVSPKDLLIPGIEPWSPTLKADSLSSEPSPFFFRHSSAEAPPSETPVTEPPGPHKNIGQEGNTDVWYGLKVCVLLKLKP